MRHVGLLAVGDLLHRLAGPQPGSLVELVQLKILGLDQRFGGVDRIGDHAHVGENVAVPDEVLDHGGQVALHQPVAPDEALLDVGGLDGQDVALPLAGGESHEGVRSVFGRMRAAVHPDGAGLLVGADVVLDGDHLLGLRVLLLPDAQVVGAAINVGDAMDAALLLGQRHAGGAPAIGAEAGGVVDGKAQIIAQLGTRAAFGLVLVTQGGPVTG